MRNDPFQCSRPGANEWPVVARRWFVATAVFIFSAALLPGALPEPAILAGHENWIPADSPSQRIDPFGPSSPFNFVGALSVVSGGSSFTGSASAISPDWLLTAAHNLDTNNDGQVDAGLSATFHLPDFGVFSAVAYYIHPNYAGFSNSIHHDVALVHLAEPLPPGLNYAGYHFGLSIGEVVTLAGFGRSGYGNYGYTTSASLTNRRIGGNTIETFTAGEGGYPEIFRYTFAHPETFGEPGGSLGNDIETLIGPGDSGGPVLVEDDGIFFLAGVNTFIQGPGGRFGTIGGGVVLEPYFGWMEEVTGLAIPEPSAIALMAGIAAFLAVLAMRRNRVRTRG